MTTDDTPTVALHQVKGLVTKFMRMLFPLEFRLDSVEDLGAAMPFRYPLISGEMIYLPDRIDRCSSREQAFRYYKVIAAHLAARHEFGTFDFRLREVPGFEQRQESGAEAFGAYLATFEDPRLASGLLRVCEMVRIDAALRRRYQGLAVDMGILYQELAEKLPTQSVTAMLLKCALELSAGNSVLEQVFAARAGQFFEPLRNVNADVALSARQMRVLYDWLDDLMKGAEASEEGRQLEDRQRTELDELAGALDQAEGLEGMETGDDAQMPGEPGETDQSVSMRASGKRGRGAAGQPLSAEDIRRLIERGAQLRPDESDGSGASDQGIYLTQLTDKQARELQELQEQLAEAASFAGHGRLVTGSRTGQDAYYAYDEWDHVQGDYRRDWCRLREVVVDGEDMTFYQRTLERYAELLPQVRRHFQRIRPASYRMVRGLEDGEEIDFDRSIEARVARLIGESPDPRLYKARRKESRDVATLFLLDMSASTDEPIQREPRRADGDDQDDWLKVWQRRPSPKDRPRRIIDVNKEALVIMAQALEELGDSYAIMGFSGHGRDNVEFYVIKEFERELTDEVKSRVGAVQPKRSTRMGTAIRHVREKFKDITCRSKHVILLSDGFPQDFDYGQDRRSNAYGIQDTMVALKELELAGVLPFCITVDRTGHDYLREMCQSSRYLVIDDIGSLPRQLPKIYEQIVRW